jgi:rare lipoprotein A
MSQNSFDLHKRQVINLFHVLAVCGLMGLAVLGCSKAKPPPKPTGYPKPYRVGNTWYQPLPHARGFTQSGIASWYGKKFHGRKTSNGEIYDMYAMTAAHKTLPFGTYVRVHNLNNNKKIEVRINDRGPFIRGRIIDLSKKAAKKLGIIGPGTAPVKIEALGVAAKQNKKKAAEPSYVPIDYYQGNFTFQVGAFRERENAERLKQQLDRTNNDTPARIIPYNNGRDTLYRVRVGKFDNLKQAIAYEKILIQNGYKNVMIVAE